MDPVKHFSRRCLMLTFLFSSFLFLTLASGHYAFYKLKIENLDAISTPYYFSGISIGLFSLCFILFVVLQWLVLNRFFKQSLAFWENAVKTTRPSTVTKTDPLAEKKKRLREDKRLFLHLMSALQRKGRLLDFFSEDLTLYDDGQIGAAVRNVHENCNLVINQYISPKPMLKAPEGDDITIDETFDENAINLVGNVTGNPPFKGIVRHKGWIADKVTLPELSDTSSPGIISQAEIEIM